MIIETERLILRPFEDRDYAPFAAMNADPEVMRYFPGMLSRTQSDALIEKIETARKQVGFCLLAAERKDIVGCIGFIGTIKIPDEMRAALRGAPQIEIGWRLGSAFWGQGLAPEGARACLNYAWKTLGLEEIVSFTATLNLPSQAVMRKIGMRHDAEAVFEHPKLLEGHRLRPHVLYRVKNPNLL